MPDADVVVGWSFEKVMLNKINKDGTKSSKVFDNVPVHAVMTKGGKPKLTVFGTINPTLVGNMDELEKSITKKLASKGKKKVVSKLRRKIKAVA